MRLFLTHAFAGAFLLIASLTASAQTTIDPLWVHIYPGTNIQTRVNQFPGATTFYLRAGTHRRQTVVPKTDNRFIGEAGAVLDGENVTALAFSTVTARSSRVTIKGLAIRNYASGSGQGAIQGDGGTSWVVEDNSVYRNKVIGIRCGPSWQVRRNKVYQNGVIGISGYKANGTIVENNEVYENNYMQAQEQAILSQASGIKFGVTANVIIRSNMVRNNYAKGIWVDHSLPTTIIENNTVRDNAHQGIFFEASYTAKIRYNTSERNGGASATGYWLARAGIQIVNSPGAEVHNNTVSYNANGITAMNTTGSAGMTAPLGPLKIQNLYVHDNVIRMRVGRSGVGQNTGEKQVYTSWNNRFVRNTYYLGANSTYFTWNELNLTPAQWRAYGLDTTGLFYRF
jgi:parallel beta-helix repeat protein